jgi:methylmalonyl-CoA mutase cobalamin-binding subunit
MGQDEHLARVRVVRSALERVGQDVGARLLEQPLHRRAIIGVAFDFGL